MNSIPNYLYTDGLTVEGSMARREALAAAEITPLWTPFETLASFMIKCMPYCKYRYVVGQMIRATGDTNLIGLDPEAELTIDERQGMLRLVSDTDLLWAQDLTVLVVDAPFQNIETARVRNRTQCQYIDERFTFGHDNKYSIVLRCVTEVRNVGSERDRLSLTRLRAADDASLSPRQMLLLCDLGIPASVIPLDDRARTIEMIAAVRPAMHRSFLRA